MPLLILKCQSFVQDTLATCVANIIAYLYFAYFLFSIHITL
jgi:hypothetical protein